VGVSCDGDVVGIVFLFETETIYHLFVPDASFEEKKSFVPSIINRRNIRGALLTEMAGELSFFFIFGSAFFVNFSQSREEIPYGLERLLDGIVHKGVDFVAMHKFESVVPNFFYKGVRDFFEQGMISLTAFYMHIMIAGNESNIKFINPVEEVFPGGYNSLWFVPPKLEEISENDESAGIVVNVIEERIEQDIPRSEEVIPAGSVADVQITYNVKRSI